MTFLFTNESRKASTVTAENGLASKQEIILLVMFLKFSLLLPVLCSEISLSLDLCLTFSASVFPQLGCLRVELLVCLCAFVYAYMCAFHGQYLLRAKLL